MVTEKKQIVLASASPRRAELLDKIDMPFRQHPVHIDETIKENEEPRLYASRVAKEKAVHCRKECEGCLVLSADTIVIVGEEILLKPKNHHEAFDMLRLLSGNWHSVITAMALVTDEKQVNVLSETRVKFKTMSEREMEWYISTDEPWDKAGAYGIQGKASLFIERFEGDYDTVVGLPVRQLPELFHQAGLDLFSLIN